MIIIFVVVLLLNVHSADKLNELPDETQDILFNVIPYIPNKIHDYISISLVFMYLFFGKNHIQLLKLSIVLFVLRVIFINLTVLPATSQECKKTNHLPLTGKCRDLVFSGHTGICILIILHLISEGFISMQIGIGIVSCLVYSIIADRAHYTLDIVIGGLTSLFIYTKFRVSCLKLWS